MSQYPPANSHVDSVYKDMTMHALFVLRYTKRFVMVKGVESIIIILWVISGTRWRGAAMPQ